MGGIESGVHVINRNAIAPLLEGAEARFRVFKLVAGGISSKAILIKELQRALALPDYVGSNWDALEECLRDLLTNDKQGLLLLVDPGEALLGLPNQDLRMFLSILRSTAHFWASEGIQFTAVLVASSDALTQVVATTESTQN